MNLLTPTIGKVFQKVHTRDSLLRTPFSFIRIIVFRNLAVGGLNTLGLTLGGG